MPQIRAVEIRLRVTRFCRSEINIMGRLQHSAHRQAAGSKRQAQIGKNRCRQQERSTPALRCSHALRLLYPQEGRSSIICHTRCAEHAAPPRAIGTQIHLQIPTGICTGNKKLCHIIAPQLFLKTAGPSPRMHRRYLRPLCFKKQPCFRLRQTITIRRIHTPAVPFLA